MWEMSGENSQSEGRGGGEERSRCRWSMTRSEAAEKDALFGHDISRRCGDTECVNGEGCGACQEEGSKGAQRDEEEEKQ